MEASMTRRFARAFGSSYRRRAHLARVRTVCILAAPLVAGATAHADKTWTGSTGNWDVGSNWFGGVAPTNPSENAFLTHGGTTLVPAGVSGVGAPALGPGSLTISGGTLTSSAATVGTGTDSLGIANISAGYWNIGTALAVGNFGGIGSLTLSGGSITSGIGTLGQSSTSRGTVNVSGGTWTNAGTLVAGNAGIGTLNITGGLTSASRIRLGNLGATAGGNIILGSGGVLATGTIETGLGNGSLLFNGGTLRATSNGATILAVSDSTQIEAGPNGAIIDTNGNSVRVSHDITGAGGLKKVGNGTLTLSNDGTNFSTFSYAGGTTVASGVLVVEGTDLAISHPSAVTEIGPEQS